MPRPPSAWGVGRGRPGRGRGVPVVPRRASACDAGEYRRCRAPRHRRHVRLHRRRPRRRGCGAATRPTSTSAPDSLLLPVPDDLDPVVATLFNPLGAGIRWGVDGARAPSRATSSPCSAPASAACRRGGRGQGGGRRLRDGHRRRARATRDRLDAGRGASAPTSPSTSRSTIRSRALRAATGGLADVVVDVTAKAPAALGQAVRLARPGGTIVLAGTRGSAETPGFRPDDRRLQGAAPGRGTRCRRRRVSRGARAPVVAPMAVRRPAPTGGRPRRRRRPAHRPVR